VRLALRRRQDWPALFRGLERWLASLDRSSLEDLP